MHAQHREDLARRSASAPDAGDLARPWHIVLVVFVAGAVALNMFWPLSEPSGAIGIAALLTVLWTAGRATRRGRSSDGGWRLTFGGLALAASGIVPFALREVFGLSIPELTGHVVLFLSYSAFAAGLVWLARPHGSTPKIDLDGVIDMAVIGVLAATLIWQFVGRDVVAEARLQPSMVVLALIHSVFIVVLLSLATRAIVRRSGAPDTYLLAGGMACLTVANLAYLIHVDPSDTGSWAATTWLAGLLVIGLAVTSNRPVRPDPEPDGDRLLPLGRVALTLAPVPIPVAAALLYEHPLTADRWTVPLATVALTGLALLRAARLLSSAREAWTRLAARERLFQVLATNSSDAVLRVERDGSADVESLTIPALTRSGQTIDGERTDIALDLTTLDGDAYRGLLGRAISRPGVPTYAELPVRDHQGTQLWVGARAVDLVHDPAVGAVVINLHDITERKQAEEELTYQALHDSLTGLPNRALFRDRLEHALAQRSRRSGDAALLYLDLDGFKGINDGLGHEMGDRLLRQVADRLAALTRNDETVARLGGDEFAVLVEVSDQPRTDAVVAAERIVAAIQEPFDLDDRRVSVSVSIGIATSDLDSTAAGMLRNADIAMYEAKAAGRGRWAYYEACMDRDTQELLQLESDLVGALERDEFELHYQPLVDLTSQRTIGFEALLRWHHPTKGIVPPDRFIPTLERTGAIVEVGRWVLHTACDTLADLQQRFGLTLTMSVNLSGRQLDRDDLADQVREELASSGVRPQDLMLEMTETFLVDNDHAAQQLQRLHELGVKIAIDDFGTGYSALAYLRRYPIDTIKIDRSFIAAIEDTGTLPALVRGLLDLGQTLEMSTIAEGIELELQSDLLRDQGCRLGQGFLFARPMPADQAALHLSEQCGVAAMTS